MGDYMEKAQFQFHHGNFKDAEETFTYIVDQSDDPEEVLEALKKRSTCRHELGMYQDALDDGNLVRKAEPKATTGYALCGRALAKLKKFEEALEVFKLGLEIDRNDVEVTTGLKDMQADILENFEKSSESSYDAVTMSSQEPYPGDGELEALEREIMQKWGISEFPPIDFIRPDTKMALREYEAALQYKRAGNDKQALEKMRLEFCGHSPKVYNIAEFATSIMKSSLKYDPANFTLRGELATLLYDMGDYKEAYQHCQCIPIDFREAKYWKIGGKVLDALDLPVHAESWLRHSCKLDKKDRDIHVLFQNIRVKRLYGPLTQGTKVNVKFTQYGRAVVAQEDCKVGDACFRDKAVILAQTLDTLHVPACSHCAKCLMSGEDHFGADVLAKDADLRKIVQRHWPIRPRINCKGKGCKIIYCSTECRDESWNTYHQILCCSVNPAIEELHTICSQYTNLTYDSQCWKGVWNASYSPFVLAKIWASIICLAHNLAITEGKEIPAQSHWTMAKSPFRKFIAYGSTSVINVVPKMVTLMQKIFDNADLPEHFRYKITHKEFDGRYFQATCNVQAFSDPVPPFKLFMASAMRDTKRDVLQGYSRKEPADALFAGMFPLHACLNHSCANNVEVLDGHPGVLVRARLPVKKGDELFTTYINTSLPRKERRAWLFRGYNFWCQCLRCKFEGDGPEKCTECGKEAKDDEKDKYPGCGKCHRAWYCSTTCQKAAWKKGHKKICSMPHSNITNNNDPAYILHV